MLPEHPNVSANLVLERFQITNNVPTGAPSLPITRDPFADRVAFRESGPTSALVGRLGVGRHHCSFELSGVAQRAERNLLPSVAMSESGRNIPCTLGHTLKTRSAPTDGSLPMKYSQSILGET